MPEQPTLEQLLIEAVQCHIARSRGPGYSLTFVQLGICGPDGLESEVSLRPAGRFPLRGELPHCPAQDPSQATPAPGQASGGPGTGHEQTDVRALTPLERAIMDVLRVAERPVKGILLSRRAGKDYTSYFRGVLAQMQRREPPLIIHLAGGYWDASRPLNVRSDGPDVDESQGDGLDSVES